MSVQKALGTVLGVEGVRLEEDSLSPKSTDMQPEEETEGLKKKILRAPIWGGQEEDRRQIVMRILDQEASGKQAPYKICLSRGAPLHVDSPLYCMLAPEPDLQEKSRHLMIPSSIPPDCMEHVERTGLPLATRACSSLVKDSTEEGGGYIRQSLRGGGFA